MNIDDQVAILMQGTEYGDESLKHSMETELKSRLVEAEKEGRKLKVYCGYDPRTTDLHIGHTVTMRKLRQFQELGHEVTFLIGNYTSLIGDPSDKDVLRPRLTPEEVEQNGRTYAQQAFRILDPKKTIIRYNAEWLSKLNFAELIHLAANFTVQQFLTRENFKKRWDNGDAVYLHETFYAIMQGYDAYALNTDCQVGGTDQLFNIITAGRKLMTAMGSKPNIGIILAILPGTDGVVKMSKSLGNHIPINSNADDMYGKVMSVPDAAMPSYSRLVTRWNPGQIDKMEKDLKSGSLHPRDAKMKLAWEITSTFYSDSEAEKAQENFVQLFQKKQIPDDMPEFVITELDKKIYDVVFTSGCATSGSEAKNKIKGKGVRFNGELITDPFATINKPGILQVGKREFRKVVINYRQKR